MIATENAVILGPDPRTSWGRDPRVRPEDDGTMNRIRSEEAA